MTAPTQPPTTPFGSTGLTGGPPAYPPPSASLVASWNADFNHDHALLQTQGINAAPLVAIQQQNLDKLWNFTLDLASRLPVADIMKALVEDQRIYEGTLEPRRAAIDDANRKVQALSRALSAPGMPSGFRSSLFDLELAFTLFADRHRELARDLRRAVKRGQRRRFFLESTHAVIALSVFNLLFGLVAESVCGWLHDAFNLPTTTSFCDEVKFVAIILLFVGERWWLGPRIDEWLTEKARIATGEACNRYYHQRTHAEYALAVIEDQITQTRARLQAIKVVI